MATDCICARCGTRGPGKRVTKGSFLIELFLWLCLIVPGLVYSLWRLTTKHTACRKCGSTELVPVDTPMGRKLGEQFGPSAGSSSP